MANMGYDLVIGKHPLTKGMKMNVKASPSEARTDMTRWLEERGADRQGPNPFPEENIALIGNAVEAAAADGNWSRTEWNMESELDVLLLTMDLAPHMKPLKSLPVFIGEILTTTFIARVAGALGYRHN